MFNNTDHMNLHVRTDKYKIKPYPSTHKIKSTCGILELGNVYGKLMVIHQTNTFYSVNQYINALHNCHLEILSMFNLISKLLDFYFFKIRIMNK